MSDKVNEFAKGFEDQLKDAMAKAIARHEAEIAHSLFGCSNPTTCTICIDYEERSKYCGECGRPYDQGDPV